ncbi:MAG: bifunctional proline dehydrogenase/L-glutamate gamma-semialdehyde dehydrogenase PutA [Pseudomonadota bacterium]|nr:bifunctional proline dehydrogenase/L-glutamate gamma-semialdehyde dehydrogenase PutA [Pseudomonadota bacterium]
MPDVATAAPDLRALPAFEAPWSIDDTRLLQELCADIALGPAASEKVDDTARELIAAIRADSDNLGGVEDFLREFGLTNREGLALMVLAEALLRVPDAATQDRLIGDKLGTGDWSSHLGHAESFLVNAAAWGLGISSRIVHPSETPLGVIDGLIRRVGAPAVRTATRQAMRMLGQHFVLGETIGAALERARANERRGYRHSYDMLGEGARTRADADHYLEAYSSAIAAIGAAARGGHLPARPGISVKLSALHPRYEAVNIAELRAELVPRLVDLALTARANDLNMTVDAEEADRLELSLDIIGRVAADPRLAGWDGFGLAIQAYQKRAPAVVDWVIALARHLDRRFMVRLVKGAYWDTEVKRAQERGLDDYPVFTRKPATDVSYIACARKLLAARPDIYPQFATHNALTVATLLQMTGDDPSGFEFQRLHGMGEALYDHLVEARKVPCRIYAPVGGHRELLAYLVRRLLENGANSSFVAVVGDREVPVERLLERPERQVDFGAHARHPKIPMPAAIFRRRPNSRGVEFGDADALAALLRGVQAAALPKQVAGAGLKGPQREVLSPVDGRTVAGQVIEATPEAAAAATVRAARAFPAWAARPVGERAAILEKTADLLERDRDPLLKLLGVEAGKTLVDGIAEIREAVDFCRYYAAEARRLFAAPVLMPGVTGEENRYLMRGRGVFLCISPWNFPLAIFLGQIAAALVSGNSVIAKPAPQTPLVADHAVRLLGEAGLPKDVLQLVPGGPATGAALVERPEIGGVAFTGSTGTARAINRALAAKDGPIVPLIAETGGINAMIVDATALPEQTTDDVLMSAFRSAGQRCSALRLLCLQEDVADRFLEMIHGAALELRLGDPLDPATDIGPVIDAAARRRLEDHVAAMQARFPVTIAGDVPDEGHWMAPVIVELDRPEDLEEEVFGPVLHVVRWRADRLDDLLERIAATGYGLTLGVQSRIDGTVARVARRMDTGNIYVNRNQIGAIVGSQPFGGSGLSGTGPKAGGPGYLRRFCLEQVISINTAAAGGNASLIALEDGW